MPSEKDIETPEELEVERKLGIWSNWKAILAVIMAVLGPWSVWATAGAVVDFASLAAPIFASVLAGITSFYALLDKKVKQLEREKERIEHEQEDKLGIPHSVSEDE